MNSRSIRVNLIFESPYNSHVFTQLTLDLFQKTGVQVDLSEQYLIDCAYDGGLDGGPNGCKGRKISNVNLMSSPCFIFIY